MDPHDRRDFTPINAVHVKVQFAADDDTKSNDEHANTNAAQPGAAQGAQEEEERGIAFITLKYRAIGETLLKVYTKIVEGFDVVVYNHG